MGGAAATVRIRLFGPARTAFGRSEVAAPAGSVADALTSLLDGASPSQRHLVERCGCWVNGAPASGETSLRPGDELALLPPVSGGCGVAR